MLTARIQVAWVWIGVSRFKAVISKDCNMRGLRLRKENIQIGNEDALQKLFKEDRGHHYFIGEVFAVSKDLIPNSQRDYFNENETRLIFERELRSYFNNDLHRIYRDGSDINSAFKKIEDYEKKETEFTAKKQKGDYVNDAHLKTAEDAVAKAKSAAEKAKITIEKKKQKASDDPNSLVNKVIARIEGERNQCPASTTNPAPVKATSKKKKNVWRTDDPRLSAYSGKERKLISKIFGVIVASTDEKTAEMLIEKIEDELQ